MTISFISYKDSKNFDKTQIIHLKSDDIEIHETDEIIEELSESLLQNIKKD